MDFKYEIKAIRPNGKIVYEYNPLFNYRLNDDNGAISDLITKGESQLNFDLEHPVEISCLESYDGSINLILNDNKNQPRLINTRFTPKENNTYTRVDRLGNTDTNLYDESEFEIDTSLLKKYINIPKVNFKGVYHGGDLGVGNYVFYFKLADADGNETDIVAESGLVSIYMGLLNIPTSIRGGESNENSGKLILFKLSNIDSGYDYVSVYYSRSTGADNQERNIEAQHITNKFRVRNNSCDIHITGNENKEEIPVTELSQDFFLPSAAKTQAICQNMLMLGNVSKFTPDYENLSKLSLGFIPYYESKTEEDELGETMDYDYQAVGYYDVNNIYNKVGYWNEELYRFGVVYIMNNGSLSPVYNIRGINNVPNITNTSYDYTAYNDLVIDHDTKFINEMTLENSAGVCRIKEDPTNNSDYFKVRHFIFKAQSGLIDDLKNYNIKGYFFVRQKRIPTILCQAFMLGQDKESGIPAWKIKNSKNNNSDLWVTEGFLNSTGILTHEYQRRLIPIQASKTKTCIALCPEYELNQGYYNNIFTGSEMVIKEVTQETTLKAEPNHMYSSGQYKERSSSIFDNAKIISVQDGTTLHDNGYTFRNIAGNEDELVYIKLSGSEIEPDKDNFLDDDYLFTISNGSIGVNPNYPNKAKVKVVRGKYGPYLGVYKNNHLDTNSLINIYIPGYNVSQMLEYFRIRINADDAYFTISDRKLIDDFNSDGEDIYRGDCYICQFTHRLNRNFLDPDAPNNDIIIEPNTWYKNFDEDDTTSLSNINRGDVNAVKLGTYFTFKCYSSINLGLRDIDDGYPSEAALTGNKRSFHPFAPLKIDGHNKILESAIFNKGFNSTTSERYNYLLPAVPFIKNCFLTRVIYSNISLNDAFKNGFRVFNGISSVDYPNQYGGIVKLIDLKTHLLIVFEHGIGTAKVNQEAMIPTDDGTKIEIGAVKVLQETLTMISTDFGTQWPESICRTDNYIYGLDSTAKKIWRTDGSSIKLISDFKVLKFLNDNITLGERELTPIIGVRNIKTHYNANKHDIMFTYYDNLRGFEECVWNLCYNELQDLFITFYSWLPSYSANIDNSFFTFDRNASKWITKLGLSKSGQGIIVGNNIIKNINGTADFPDAELSLNLDDVLKKFGNYKSLKYVFTLEKSNFGDELFFEITDDSKLKLKDDCLEYEQLENYIGSRNPIIPVFQLNISCSIYGTLDNTTWETINDNFITDNLGFYKNSIYIILDTIYQHSEGTIENVNESINDVTLKTDFWKHGHAGIIDISEPIKPCYWYHKQHPFEFEYVVGNDTAGYKQFNNIVIASNNVMPESIHCTIIGDSYDFSDNKSNLYWRQEATKMFYQYHGSDILYDHKVFENPYKYYPELVTSNNELRDSYTQSLTYKDTLFTLIYARQDTFNEIEDFYKKINPAINSSDYPNITGCEIYWNSLLNLFSLCNHIKIRDIKDVGRTRGNASYINDKLLIQITPISLINFNNNWFKNSKNQTLPYLYLTNIPSDIYNVAITDVSTAFPNILKDLEYNNLNYLKQSINLSLRTEINLLDKHMKTKIRYTGDKLVTILATATTFNTIE